MQTAAKESLKYKILQGWLIDSVKYYDNQNIEIIAKLERLEIEKQTTKSWIETCSRSIFKGDKIWKGIWNFIFLEMNSL